MDVSHAQLKALDEAYPRGFYLLELHRVQENYRTLLRAFRDIYPGTRIAYSYKANYLPAVCKAMDLAGAYAEVASGMEYRLARRLGVAPERIIFNGPCKLTWELEQALLDGATVNADSLEEVEQIRKTAGRYPDKTLNIGLRCNLDMGPGMASRFGLSAENGDLRKAFDRVLETGNCRVAGLHCHMAARDRSADFYSRLAGKMVDLSALLFTATAPEFINLGGGFFSNMREELKTQFSGEIPTFDQYAACIAPHFQRFAHCGCFPRLVIEPGLALTADAMKFVSKVLAVKRLPSGNVAHMSGSVYDIKPTKNAKNLPLTVIARGGSADFADVPGPVDLCGHTCMEDDIMYRGYGGTLRPGDFVVFDQVGSYTIVLKPPFMTPCAPVLTWDAAKKAYMASKRSETFSDVFSTYVF